MLKFHLIRNKIYKSKVKTSKDSWYDTKQMAIDNLFSVNTTSPKFLTSASQEMPVYIVDL